MKPSSRPRAVDGAEAAGPVQRLAPVRALVRVLLARLLVPAEVLPLGPAEVSPALQEQGAEGVPGRRQRARAVSSSPSQTRIISSLPRCSTRARTRAIRVRVGRLSTI